MTEYSFDCRIRKRSPKTIDNYMKQLRYFQTYLEEVHGITHVEEIRRTHIKHFLSMMDEKKRKPQYINDLLKVFKTFFRYAVKEEHILINPTDGIHKSRSADLCDKLFLAVSFSPEKGDLFKAVQSACIHSQIL